jgi:hypothetical protein
VVAGGFITGKVHIETIMSERFASLLAFGLHFGWATGAIFGAFSGCFTMGIVDGATLGALSGIVGGLSGMAIVGAIGGTGNRPQGKALAKAVGGALGLAIGGVTGIGLLQRVSAVMARLVGVDEGLGTDLMIIQSIAGGIGAVIAWSMVGVCNKPLAATVAFCAVVAVLVICFIYIPVSMVLALSGATGSMIAWAVPPDVRRWRLPRRL